MICSACVRACACACVRACAHVRVACVLACMYVCVRACAHVRACARAPARAWRAARNVQAPPRCHCGGMPSYVEGCRPDWEASRAGEQRTMCDLLLLALQLGDGGAARRLSADGAAKCNGALQQDVVLLQQDIVLLQRDVVLLHVLLQRDVVLLQRDIVLLQRDVVLMGQLNTTVRICAAGTARDDLRIDEAQQRLQHALRRRVLRGRF